MGNELSIPHDETPGQEQRLTPGQHFARLVRRPGGIFTVEDLEVCKQPGENRLTFAQTMDLRQNLGFSLPIKDFWNRLIALHPKPTVLEIGCGAGLYACAFAPPIWELGGNWIATDNWETMGESDYDIGLMFPSIKTGKDPLSYLHGVPEDDQILLTVWPEPNSRYMLHYIEQFKGRYIIFVGEPGVCGHEDVYKQLTMQYGLEISDLCLYNLPGGLVHEQMFVWDKQSPADTDLVSYF
jgi:hypothetical protein